MSRLQTVTWPSISWLRPDVTERVYRKFYHDFTELSNDSLRYMRTLIEFILSAHSTILRSASTPCVVRIKFASFSV